MNRQDAKTPRRKQGMKRQIFLFVILGVLASWRFIPIPIHAATVDLPEYVRRLTVARDAITQAKTQAGMGREASIRRATEALADIDAVTVGGAAYDPQLADALDTLRRPAPDLDRALAVVGTLRDTAETTRAAAPDPNARRTLDEVLRDREFRRDEPNWLQQQIIAFRQWLREQWNRLTEPLRRVNPPDVNLPNTAQPVPGGSGLAAFFAALVSPPVLIALGVLLALFVCYLIWRGRRRKTITAAVPERTSQQWRDHAAELAGRGDHRAAVRALFLGTLRDLDERGVVPFDASCTDREYVRAVTERGDWLAAPVRPFVRLVEGISYGGARAGDAEYLEARQHADMVRAATAEAGAFAATKPVLGTGY